MGLFSKIFNAVTAPFRGIFNRERPSNFDELQDLEEEAEEEQWVEPEEPELPEHPDNFEEAWEPEDYFADSIDRFLMWDGNIMPQYEEMLDTMQKNGHIHGFSSEDSKKEFLRFLQSDFWESKKSYVYTPELMQNVQDAIENGAKASDLTNAFLEYEAWQDEEADWEEFWQGWLQVEEV